MSTLQKNEKTIDWSVEELLAAKNTAQSFSGAFKNYFLYPKGHAYAESSLAKLKNDLDNFLDAYKTLRLNVKRNGFYYKGEPVFSGESSDSNPAYLLTRDTILFIEFSLGIELDEITLLFDILDSHRKPSEEVDGDIATSLWHFSFEHLEYEAADIFALEAIEFEFSMFNAVPDQEQADQEADTSETSSSEEERPEAKASSLLEVAQESDLSELSDEERQTLQLFIMEEEKRNISSDVTDILLILLTIESDQLEFASILEFLEFEFYEALSKEDFFQAHKIVKNVHNILKAIKAKKPWSASLINIFFSSLTKEERFAELPWIKDYKGYFNSESMKNIVNILGLLPPEIMFTLASLAVQTPIDNLSVRNSLSELISGKARQDNQLFSSLLAKSDKETNLILFPIIEEMEPGVAREIYLNMTRHPSEDIRRIGMDGYFKTTNLSGPEELSHLLADDDEQVKKRMVNYLEQIGGEVTEDLLLSFLSKEGASMEDDYHILHCYKILGQYLSEKSINFLKGILLESKLTEMFSNMSTIHKHGAVYALKSLGTEEAMEILKKGSQSVRPDVRQVCLKALE